MGWRLKNLQLACISYIIAFGSVLAEELPFGELLKNKVSDLETKSWMLDQYFRSHYKRQTAVLQNGFDSLLHKLGVEKDLLTLLPWIIIFF
ncbi:MAG: hypothetical protein V4594_11995 [Bacteroidota bacterium]